MNKYVYTKIGVYYFSAEHAAIRRKREDWLVRNQDNVSEWCDISFRILLGNTEPTLLGDDHSSCVGMVGKMAYK
jgi:hypothetical protein